MTATPSTRDASTAATGADAVAHALREHGITRVFALCGDHVNSLFHAVDRAGIEIVGTRHESAAVQMADAAARVTGKPGVAIVTGGPGHTNAITGAAVAQGAQSPVVVISGQAAKARRERGGNQSLHQADLMRPVTKWAIEAEHGADLAELTARALALAAAPTPGAVSLSVPVDVADAPAGHALRRARPTSCAPRRPAAEDVLEAMRLLSGARRPVLVLGGSCEQHAPHAALRAAVRRLGIPAFTNGRARGVIADDGDVCFGHASALFNALFHAASQADAWIVAGTCIDYDIASTVAPDAKVIQIHADVRQLGVGRTPALALVADTAPALEALAAACTGADAAWRDWRSSVQARHATQQEYWNRIAPRSAGSVHPAELCRALRRRHTPDTTLVVDVGDFVNWPKAYFPALVPGQYLDGGALGNLGGALPLAIGAAVTRPNSPVWAFVGDGGFGYHAWELALAVERSLPLTVFVGSDGAWGTEKRLQRAHHGRDIACDLPAVRHDRFAALIGMRSARIETADELDSALAGLDVSKGPLLIDVRLADQAGRPYADLPRV